MLNFQNRAVFRAFQSFAFYKEQRVEELRMQKNIRMQNLKLKKLLSLKLLGFKSHESLMASIALSSKSCHRGSEALCFMLRNKFNRKNNISSDELRRRS